MQEFIEPRKLKLFIIRDPKIRKRVKKINNSYNFIGYKLKSVYEKSLKPLKVVHFHPFRIQISHPRKQFSVSGKYQI